LKDEESLTKQIESKQSYGDLLVMVVYGESPETVRKDLAEEYEPIRSYFAKMAKPDDKLFESFINYL